MAAYAATVSLLRKISIFLEYYDVVLPPLTRQVFDLLERELKSFEKFVERLDSESRRKMNASLEKMAEIILEYGEDFKAGRVRFLNEDFESFITRVVCVVEVMKAVKEEYNSLLPEEAVFVSKSEIVGFCDLRRRIKVEVMDPLLKNTPVSVYGMAGIGKTTLVWDIFQDLDILDWFDCRVWVNVGNDWRSDDPREMTEAILAQVDPEMHKMVKGRDGDEEEEMRQVLKECLKGKRYFIVLDNVWDYNCRVYLQSLFPDNDNGSQILITTRMKFVGFHPSEICNHIDMRLLDKEESWDLLCEKVCCPPHLHDYGKKIAEKCDGLPLTIVTVADLLSKADSESIWMDVATKRKHQIFIDAYDQISQVLYPSYAILDDELKVCLLYMGAFPLKYEIPKSSLINLWIVEEFVEPHVDQTLESVALKRLESLAYDSLVMVYQKDITSYMNMFSPCIKTCGLHSCWWHFCQIRARETNLFHVLDCYNEDGIEEAIQGHTRLSIHNNVLFALKHVYNSIEEICAFTARTLLCFGPYCQYMVPVCFGLKFLRRLDALNIRFYDFPLEVLKLVKLRYLALTCNGNLPSSISNLRKLQYLIVNPHLSIKSRGALFNLPVEIWNMKMLKHLQVMGYDLPNFGDTSLQELITLLNVTAHSCTILNRVPNLTKLGIEIELAPGVEEPSYSFDHISRLTKLKSLKCVVVNPEYKFEIVSSIPSFPFSLNKLSLSGMGCQWEEMSKIASLPNLEVLKLRYNAFQGSMWEVEENGFPVLESLLIEDVDLVKLKWAHGSFKNLSVLRIKHSYKLQELYLGDLQSISQIEIVECGPLVEWNVKRNSLGNFTAGNVFVHCSWKS